jgi:hypothetical protein
MSFIVLTAVTTNNTIFNNVTSCGLMHVYRCFEGAIIFLRNGVTPQKIVPQNNSYFTLL